MTETQVRELVRRVIAGAQSAAEITGTQIDDQACEMALKVVNSDLLWGWIWGLIDQWIVDPEAPILVGDAAAPIEAEAIDPITVIAIIKAAIELWKLIRK